MNDQMERRMNEQRDEWINEKMTRWMNSMVVLSCLWRLFARTLHFREVQGRLNDTKFMSFVLSKQLVQMSINTIHLEEACNHLEEYVTAVTG